MPQKICPRCGAQYASLKSATCPQCFGKLEEIDEETAAKLTEARAQIEQTDEYREAKAEEDEQFRFDSFKACFSVILIGIATVVLSVAMLYFGTRQARRMAPRSVVVSSTITPDLLTPLPRENGTLDEVLPAKVGDFHRLASDERTNLSGTTTAIYRGHYAIGVHSIDVFAIPQDRPASEITTFNNLLDVMADMSSPARSESRFKTEYWRYGALGEPGDDATIEAFRQALGEAMTPR